MIGGCYRCAEGGCTTHPGDTHGSRDGVTVRTREEILKLLADGIYPEWDGVVEVSHSWADDLMNEIEAAQTPVPAEGAD